MKNIKTPEKQNSENFLTELSSMMPKSLGSQLLIYTLVNKYFTPKTELVIPDIPKKKTKSIADPTKNS